jgi:hypothetical protein
MNYYVHFEGKMIIRIHTILYRMLYMASVSTAVKSSIGNICKNGEAANMKCYRGNLTY